MRKNMIAVVASLAFLPAVSFAAAPTLTEVLDASGVTVSGHASGSYAYQQSSNDSIPDVGTNTFTFDQAELLVAKQPAQGFGGVVNVFAGQDVAGGTYNYGFTGIDDGAEAYSLYPRGGFNNFGSGSDFNLHQAYVSYATGGLTVIGGKFATLAGYEVASDAGNFHATHSALFAFQPFTLTGVRAGYKFNDMTTVYLGLSNSASGGTVDGDDQKTVELGVALAPVKGLTINLTDYRGTDGTSIFVPGSKVESNLIDLVVAYKVGDLTVAFNGDHFRSHDVLVDLTSKTVGGALYANYQVSKALRLGVRGEMVRVENQIIFVMDTDGVITPTDIIGKGKLRGVTLTGAYSASKNFDIVGDLRYSTYTVDGEDFKQKDKAAVVKAIYKF